LNGVCVRSAVKDSRRALWRNAACSARRMDIDTKDERALRYWCEKLRRQGARASGRRLHQRRADVVVLRDYARNERIRHRGSTMTTVL
jgi:hypothetical protein